MPTFSLIIFARSEPCLSRGGLIVPAKFLFAFISAFYLLTAGPAAAAAGRCQSQQAQCAVEVGGTCNPNTGFWCVGPNRGNRTCGGTMVNFLACLDRLRGFRGVPASGTPDVIHSQAPERAAWGCGATDGKVKGKSWNYANRTAASYRALAACSSKTSSGRCRVVSCRPGVHNSEEAIAIWGPNT